MNTDIFEKILTPVLEGYMNIDFDLANKSFSIHNIQTKESGHHKKYENNYLFK